MVEMDIGIYTMVLSNSFSRIHARGVSRKIVSSSTGRCLQVGGLPLRLPLRGILVFEGPRGKSYRDLEPRRALPIGPLSCLALLGCPASTRVEAS